MTIILTEPHRPAAGRAAPPANVHADADLAARAARGEPGAFAALYQRHVEAVYHYFAFRVRDTAVAEDLTHDVFVAALRAVRTLREPEKVVGWLMRIAHNRLANHWRSAGSAAPIESEPDPDGAAFVGPDLDGVFDALTDAPRLTAALARLTPLQHDVVALRFVAGLSIAETAQAVGRTANAVKNVQHEALVKLRRELVSIETV